MKSLENSMHLYKYHLVIRTLHMLIWFFLRKKKKKPYFKSSTFQGKGLLHLKARV